MFEMTEFPAFGPGIILVGIFFWLMIIIGIILFFFWVLRKIGFVSNRSLEDDSSDNLSPVEIARIRYENGEISKEEFEVIKNNLD